MSGPIELVKGKLKVQYHKFSPPFLELRMTSQENEQYVKVQIDTLARMFDIKENDQELRDLIRKILGENDWEPEACIVPVFTALEKRKEEARAQEDEEQKKKEKQQNKDHAMRILNNMFQAVSPDEILRVLEENDGDVDATTEHFLKIVQKKDQETHGSDGQKDLLAERERKFLTDALCTRFHDFSREHIVQKLKECKWEQDKAIKDLLEERAASRSLRLSAIFSRAPTPLKSVAPNLQAEQETNEEIKQVSKLVQQIRKATDEALFKEELEKTIRGPYTDLLLRRRTDSESKQDRASSGSEQSSEHKTVVPSSSSLSEQAPSEPDELLLPDSVLKVVEQVAEGENLALSWDLSAAPPNFKPTNRDFIGLYGESDKSSEEDVNKSSEEDVSKGYKSYHWTHGAKTGSLSFCSPGYCGIYIFQYFSPTESGDTLVASSVPVRVGPVFSLKVIKPQSQQTMPMQVTLMIEQTSPKMVEFPSTGWVALYAKTDKEHRPEDKRYESYAWVSTQSRIVESEAKGGMHRVVKSMPFFIPKAGIWEFRFFPHKTYSPACRLTLSLTGHDAMQLLVEGDMMIVHCRVATVDPTTEPVWIGIFHSNESNPRQYRRCKYVTEGGVSTFTFKKCIHTGDYEARLMAGKSFEVLASSDTVHVDGVTGGYWL
eukprot:g62071.t1